VPADLEFRPSRYPCKPSVENQLVLLVNLDAFPGMPGVRLSIVSEEGAVGIGPSRTDKYEIKVQSGWRMPGWNVAKVVVPCWGSAWGAKAVISAKAKRTDGGVARAQCKVDFREERGRDQYQDIQYEELERQTLGEAAGRYIYVNSRPPLHRKLFGDSQETFDKALEENPIAQGRVASIVTDAVVYAVATTKFMKGGEKGLSIGSVDPITDVRRFVDEKRYDLDSKIVRAFLRET